MRHIPVLLKEVITALDPKQGEFFVDATVNGGGYANGIIRKIDASGKFLGIDWDKRILEQAKEDILSKYKACDTQYIFVSDNFANTHQILKAKKLGRADGLVLDLGFSTEQIENSGKGFSFMRDEPLIMTYSDESQPVADILKKLTEKELEKIIQEFGEERFSGRIAKAIKENQKLKPIQTAKALAKIIKSAVPKNYEKGRIHPATRTFQALRIYANKELENLEKILKNLKSILKPGGRVAIVSFHSLEDRIVKKNFKDLSQSKTMELITKKPITPSLDEIRNNPRSRSAKLRAAIIK